VTRDNNDDDDDDDNNNDNDNNNIIIIIIIIRLGISSSTRRTSYALAPAVVTLKDCLTLRNAMYKL
jgi:hypothetical protein